MYEKYEYWHEIFKYIPPFTLCYKASIPITIKINTE